MSLMGRVRALVFGAIAAGISIFLPGCGLVSTDKPLYRAQEVVIDPQLLGIWATPSSADHPGEVVIFARGDGNRYRISALPDQTNDPMSRIEMDLVRLGKYEYLFFGLPNSTGTLLFPAYRVRVVGREMRMSLLNEPQFVEELKNHPGMLTYTAQTVGLPMPATQPSGKARPVATSQPTTYPVTTNVVLTDDPAKIRHLLIQHEDDPNWFAEVLVLHRMTPAVPR